MNSKGALPTRRTSATGCVKQTNFREWLLAPEGAGPSEFGRIFKSFGYPIVVNQRNLPPAVRCMFVCMLLAEPQNNEQIIRTAE